MLVAMPGAGNDWFRVRTSPSYTWATLLALQRCRSQHLEMRPPHSFCLMRCHLQAFVLFSSAAAAEKAKAAINGRMFSGRTLHVDLVSQDAFASV